MKKLFGKARATAAPTREGREGETDSQSAATSANSASGGESLRPNLKHEGVAHDSVKVTVVSSENLPKVRTVSISGCDLSSPVCLLYAMV